MNKEERQAYELLQQFTAYISSRNSAALQLKFHLSPAVIEEIYESVDDYFDHGVQLSIASDSHVADVQAGGRKMIDFYSMDNGGVGVECVLIAGNEISEAILHAEFFFDSEHCSLNYKYIGS